MSPEKRFESDDLLAAIVRSSEDAIIGETLEGVITSWNRGAEKIYGYTGEEILGQQGSALLPADHLHEMEIIIEQIRRGRGIEPYDTKRLRHDGTVFNASVSVSPIEDVDGNVIGAATITRDITVQKHADEHARSLVEASLDPMVVVDPEGRIMDVNRALEAATDSSREELVGSSVFEYFTKPEAGMEAARKVFAEGYLRDIPLVIRSSSGRLTDVIWNASVIRDDQGNIEGALGVARDITESKQAAEAMDRLSRQNKMILNSAGEGIYGADALGNITFVNPAAAHMLGYQVDELLGKNSHDTFHHTKIDGSPLPLEECLLHASLLNGEKSESKDEVFWTKRGNPINVEYINTPMTQDGIIAGAVVIFRDITDRLRDEEAIRQSEARFRSYIELTGQLAWTANADGRVEDDNPLWRRFTGQSYEEVKGWGWSKALHPDDWERAVKAWSEAVETKSEYEAEYRVRRYDGVYRHFLARGVPVLGEDGTIREWVGTCIDITAQKQAQAQLDEQRTREQDRLAELERFQKLTVGRELKMIELKKEIDDLRRRLGEAA